MTKQHGAALMVMLVIMVMGGAAFLVSSLSKSALKTVRQETTAQALAQAKEALIGYAFNVSGIVRRLGNLPDPDRLVPAPEEPATTDGHPNYNGYEDGCPGALPTCTGRLPWRDMGMHISGPSENDPAGLMPWYAFSRNLEKGQPFNSELLNAATYPWLTVRDMNGNVLSDRVAFIVIIPGLPLSGQSRPEASINPAVSLGGSNQYLDSITVPNGCTTPCVPGSYNNYGTTISFIMGDEHRWIDDPANPGKKIEDPDYIFNDRLIYVTINELVPLIERRIAREVKNCLDDYAAAASNTGHKYPWAAPVSDSTAYPGRTGTYDVRFGKMPDMPSNATFSGADNTMPSSWLGIPSCNSLITSTYWADWRDLVFYQVADGYQPGSTGACISCLSISGSGNPASGNGTYRAAVILAGQKLPGQTRPSTNNPPDDYLEATGGNSHQSLAGATPSVNFTTYKSSDTINYSSINDLVLCIDGRINCQ